jgi:hypothetical protein
VVVAHLYPAALVEMVLTLYSSVLFNVCFAIIKIVHSMEIFDEL